MTEKMDVQNMPKVVPMEEREWFVLFAICVAGKSAKQTAKKLNSFLLGAELDAAVWSGWFEWLRNLPDDSLDRAVRFFKFGQYKRIIKAFREVAKLDVTKDLTVEKLEVIPGIGPKTARFIVLYTDPNADCVPLDTHILKFLKEYFPECKVPKSTPPAGKTYNKLEKMFQEAAKSKGKSVRQLDTEVWQSYARI
jgi:endonuclease III